MWSAALVPLVAVLAGPPDRAPLPQSLAEDDLLLVVAEPDFTLGALPTTLRMPAGKFAFRMTHRFSRPIASGSAGALFADFFGFDSSAKIGLEVRYGIRPGTQVTALRTNDRAIQVLGQHEVVRQGGRAGLTLHALGALEGGNNFSEDFGLALGAVLSRRYDDRGAFYVQPMFALNANPADAPVDDDVFLMAFGGRLRLGATRTYLVAETAPRLGGYGEGSDHVSIGIERRSGGHLFQFVVSNTLAATMRQVARGGPAGGGWYVGFNLTRRFF
jgi:hypothetical protein